eukprot:10899810-Lingulodinium_polyedra.AAC.1
MPTSSTSTSSHGWPSRCTTCQSLISLLLRRLHPSGWFWGCQQTSWSWCPTTGGWSGPMANCRWLTPWPMMTVSPGSWPTPS